MAVRSPHLLQFFFSAIAATAVGHVTSLAPLEPQEGVWFGVNTNNQIGQKKYAELYNIEPVTFGTFIQLPMRQEDFLYLGQFLSQVAERKGIALVTLEPNLGLETVTEASAVALAQFLKSYEVKGASFMVRFAHEMNGSWYPWSQMPTLYIEKFRLVARTLRAIVRNLAMLWAPNNGAGYPFLGGSYCCIKGNDTCAEFPVLDTNGDGMLDVYDDMYNPYYPGDDAVDWVGMTLYHWGLAAPWGENHVAEPRVFYNRLIGNFVGPFANESMIPDFYHSFCTDDVHHKPMAIPETSALFNVNASCCDDELAVKSSWWTQVFNVQGDNEHAVDVSQRLPRIKMINWFDFRKPEGEINFQIADWTFTHNKTVHDAFVNYLSQPTADGRKHWKLLGDFRAHTANLNVFDTSLIERGELSAPRA